MTNSICSVRIPESMHRELKESIKKDHYLDLSEAVRGVIRSRWLEYKDPSSFQIKKLRQDIKGIVKEKTKKSKEEHLVAELEKIKDLILNREVKE